jgi:hypothetical protein
VVSRGDLTRGVTRREGGGDEELLSYSVHSESPKRPHVESRNWLSGIGILFSFGNNEPPPKRYDPGGSGLEPVRGSRRVKARVCVRELQTLRSTSPRNAEFRSFSAETRTLCSAAG